MPRLKLLPLLKEERDRLFLRLKLHTPQPLLITGTETKRSAITYTANMSCEKTSQGGKHKTTSSSEIFSLSGVVHKEALLVNKI